MSLLSNAIRSAIADVLTDRADERATVEDVAGLTDGIAVRMTIQEAAEVAAAVAARTVLATLLTLDGVRTRYGWSAATVRQYRAGGVLPEPDAVFGRTPVWLPSTLDAWEPTRPGQGAGGGRPAKK